MKLYLITDDGDTLVGMRLAGIEGELVNTKEDTIAVVEKLLLNEEIGLIMISSSLAALIPNQLVEYKKKNKTLFVEIPDKDSTAPCSSITAYVRNSIGIKV